MKVGSDALAGIIFIVFGIGTMALGWGYGLGTMNQPGSGAMPVMAGAALALLGMAQMLKVRMEAGDTALRKPAFSVSEIRPLLVILAAVFAFATLILPTGLIPALIALIAIAWFAQKGGARWELFGAMILVVVVITAIFKFGLGLPLRLFAWGF